MLGFNEKTKEETLKKIIEIINKVPKLENFREYLSDDFNKICDVFERLSAPDTETGNVPVITEENKAELAKLYDNMIQDLRYVLGNFPDDLYDEMEEFEKLADDISGDSVFIQSFKLENDSTLSKINEQHDITLAKFKTVAERVSKNDEDIKKNVVTNPKDAMGNHAGQNDDMRYMNKHMLGNIANSYRTLIEDMESDNLVEAEGKVHIDAKLSENIEQIKKIINDIEEYSKIDSTAVDEDLINDSGKGEKLHEKEVRLYDSILSNLINLNDDLQDQGIRRKVEDKYYNSIFRMAANFVNYFDGQRDGNLVPYDKNAKVINAKGMNIEKLFNQLGEQEKLNYYPDEPLFPHDPSLNDIRQGEIGDCYLVSSLSSIAINNAEQIKNCMVDNKDGTVTVRFWQKNPGENGITGENDTYTPIYVTVDKAVPERGSAQGCLWVQLIERAYAASGLTTFVSHSSDSDAYNEIAPDQKKLDKLYEEYSKLPVHERPSHTECPWLIDDEGKLHKYTPKYQNIDGGQTGRFIEHLLGKGFYNNPIQMSNYLFDSIEPMNSFDNVLIDALKNNDPCLFNDEVEMSHFSHLLENGKGRDSYYDLMYRLISNTKNPIPRNENGGIDIQNDDALAAYMATEDIISYMDSLRNDILANNKEHLNMDNMIEEIGKLQADTQNKNYVFRNIMSERGIKDTKYNNLIFNISNRIDRLHDDNKPHKQYDGQYNKKENDLYDKIKRALKYKEPVTLSTKLSPNNTGDREALNGMNYKHGYTVTGVVEQRINGKMLKFLKVRNPHAQKGRKYGVNEKGETFAYPSKSAKNGEGLIELSDVIKECSRVNINEKRLPKKIMPSGITKPVTREDISKYMRCLEPLMNQFNTKSWTGNDSPEYKNVQKSLTQLKIFMPDYLGKDMTQLSDLIGETEKYVNQYLKHCAKEPNSTGVRAKRMEAAYALKELSYAAKNNIKDPNMEAKKQTAQSITEILFDMKKIKRDENAIKSYAEILMKSKEFVKSYGKGNYMQINKVNQMEPKKISKAFLDFYEKLHAPSVEAPDIAKNKEQIQIENKEQSVVNLH